MKKRTKIVLGVLGGLIVLGAGAVVWQWNNVQAVQMAFSMDSETIERKLEENEQTLKQTMQEYDLTDYTFTAEETQALAEGALTTEDAVTKLMTEKPQPETPAAQPQQPAEPTVQEKIQQQVATMYVLQATFEGKLDQIMQQAIEEYAAGNQSKQEIVNQHLEEIAALEQECNARVDEVAAALKPLLKEAGQSNDLIKQIQNTYANEKSLKKAYYMSKVKE